MAAGSAIKHCMLLEKFIRCKLPFKKLCKRYQNMYIHITTAKPCTIFPVHNRTEESREGSETPAADPPRHVPVPRRRGAAPAHPLPHHAARVPPLAA